MRIDEQEEFYNNQWTHNTKLNSLNLRRAVKILSYFTFVKRKISNPVILDMGCGEGRLTAFLGEYGMAEGIELSSVAVNRANKLYPHVKFVQADVLNYTLNEGHYDVVISQEVIEHIEEQAAYLNQCAKALKKGGYLILTTPNKSVLDALESEQPWSNQPIEKVLTASELKALLKPKFKIIDFDSIVFNFGKKGWFSIVNHRLILGICNQIGLKTFREYVLGKMGYGLHLCVLVQKK